MERGIFYGKTDRIKNRARGLDPLTDVPYGYCHCGCGNKTGIAKKTERGNTKGEPLRFLVGHKAKSKTQRKSSGYILEFAKGHPRASKKGYVKQHILVMEKHLGTHIPEGFDIHHINRDKADNRIENLILLTLSEHQALHPRLPRAITVTEFKCFYCKKVDNPANMKKDRNKKTVYFHQKCKSDYWKARRPSRAKKAGVAGG